MGIGLLFVNNGHQDLYLPIFHENREVGLSVLTDALKKIDEAQKSSSAAYFVIADNLGRERTGAHLFIGPEAVSEQCLGGREHACKEALFIFAVDFSAKKVIALK